MNFCVDRYSISVFIFVGYYCFSFDYPIADSCLLFGAGQLGFIALSESIGFNGPQYDHADLRG